MSPSRSRKENKSLHWTDQDPSQLLDTDEGSTSLTVCWTLLRGENTEVTCMPFGSLLQWPASQPWLKGSHVAGIPELSPGVAGYSHVGASAVFVEHGQADVFADNVVHPPGATESRSSAYDGLLCCKRQPAHPTGRSLDRNQLACLADIAMPFADTSQRSMSEKSERLMPERPFEELAKKGITLEVIREFWKSQGKVLTDPRSVELSVTILHGQGKSEKIIYPPLPIDVQYEEDGESKSLHIEATSRTADLMHGALISYLHRVCQEFIRISTNR